MSRADLIKFFEEELPKLTHQCGHRGDAAQLADAIIQRHIVIEDAQVYNSPMPAAAENAHDADYRRRAALRCVALLEDAMHSNGGNYSGSLVPNLTSVALLLSCPFPEVLEAIAQFPALDPDRQYPGTN